MDSDNRLVVSEKPNGQQIPPGNIFHANKEQVDQKSESSNVQGWQVLA